MKTTMVRRRMEGPGKRRAIRDTGCCARLVGRRCRRLPLGGSLQVFPDLRSLNLGFRVVVAARTP